MRFNSAFKGLNGLPGILFSLHLCVTGMTDQALK